MDGHLESEHYSRGTSPVTRDRPWAVETSPIEARPAWWANRSVTTRRCLSVSVMRACGAARGLPHV